MLEEIKLKALPGKFRLRQAQGLMLTQVRDAVRFGKKKIVAHLGTGGGKTVFAGMVFYSSFKKNPRSQCWFIVNRNTLADQAKAEFEKFFGFDCGIVQGDRPLELHKHVQIATIQTLTNRLNSDNPSVWSQFRNLPVNVVVADEVHLDFKGYRDIYDKWDPLMIGLTATPFTRGMGLFWDALARPVPMSDLIKDGTLCDYRVRACVSVDRNNLEVSSTGEYKDSGIEKEVGRIIGDVYKEWAASDDMKGRPFLGFAKNISSCIALSELFNSNGARTAFVHSKMSDGAVSATLASFKAGHYDGVFSVIKLIEGFDFPDVSALILCSPMAPSKHDPNIPNSCNRYVQSAGRGLRSSPGKDYCLIHDHTGNYMQYGAYELIENLFPGLDDGKAKKKRLTTEERIERAPRECSNCRMVFSGALCCYCGHKPKKPTQFLEAGDLDFADGKMIEIKKACSEKEKRKINREMSWADKAIFYGQLKTYCSMKGMKKGWAAYKYKARFGVWPNDKRVSSAKRVKLTKEVKDWITSQNIAYANRRKSA